MPLGRENTVINAESVATDPEKTQAVEGWPTPHSVRELQAFLVTVDYYHQYVENFATIAKPLTILTGKKAA